MPSVSPHPPLIPEMPFLELFHLPSTHILHILHILSNGTSLIKQPQFYFNGHTSSFPESPFSVGRTTLWDLISGVTVSGLVPGPSYHGSFSKPTAFDSYNSWPNASHLSPQWCLIECHSTLRKHLLPVSVFSGGLSSYLIALLLPWSAQYLEMWLSYQKAIPKILLKHKGGIPFELPAVACNPEPSS